MTYYTVKQNLSLTQIADGFKKAGYVDYFSMPALEYIFDMLAMYCEDDNGDHVIPLDYIAIVSKFCELTTFSEVADYSPDLVEMMEDYMIETGIVAETDEEKFDLIHTLIMEEGGSYYSDCNDETLHAISDRLNGKDYKSLIAEY